MIKFFRKNRQRLLTENKYSKYFHYADGEIALLVIGILIAFQINNWNENRKVDNTRENYFRQLLSDLETDKTYYNSVISSLESSSVGYNNYKKIYKEPGLNISKIFIQLGKLEYSVLQIEYKTSTIKTLISTGEIKLIPNTLRNKLTLYNGIQSSAMMAANGNNDATQNILQNAMMNGAIIVLGKRLQNQPEFSKFLDIEKNWPKLFLELEASLYWKEFGENVTIRSFKSLIKDADTIIASINKELEK